MARKTSDDTEKKGAWAKLKGKVGGAFSAAGNFLWESTKRVVPAAGLGYIGLKFGQSAWESFQETGFNNADDTMGIAVKGVMAAGFGAGVASTLKNGFGTKSLKWAFRAAIASGLGYAGGQIIEGIVDSKKGASAEPFVETREELEETKRGAIADMELDVQEQTEALLVNEFSK